MIYALAMFASRRARAKATLALTAVLLGGCSMTPKSAPAVADATSTLSFDFDLESAQADDVDQVLKISNTGGTAVAPVLRFTALDKSGQPIPGVVAYSVFGAEAGRLVVPVGESIDLMRFSGKRASEVADIDVAIEKAPQIDFPEVRGAVVATPVDSAGKQTRLSGKTTQVRLTNGNDVPVPVRVLYVVWQLPDKEETQKVWTALPVGDLITVPAKGSTVVPMTEAWTRAEYGDAPASLMVFYSH